MVTKSAIDRYKYFEKVSSNIQDVAILLQHAIDIPSTGDLDVAENGVKCFQVC